MLPSVRKSFNITFIIIIILFFLNCYCSILFADGRRSALNISPILFYYPETRLGAGAALNFTYLTGEGSQVPPSNLYAVLIYTQNRQFTGELKYDHAWGSGGFISSIDVLFKEYPDKFYGIGNSTDAGDEEHYTHTYAQLRVSAQCRSAPHFYIGAGYEFGFSKNRDLEEGGRLEIGLITGSGGGVDSGVGIFSFYDTRDSRFFPASGGRYGFSIWTFNHILGSDYDFFRYSLDLRKYMSPLFKHVLAFQMYLSAMSGEVPFHRLSLLGGKNLLRGYYLGRYRDKNMLVFQAEYRMPLIWRFGGVIFGGIGDVSDNLTSFTLQEFKYSVGGGLRLMLHSREHINLRMDYAMGRESSGFYIALFEAF